MSASNFLACFAETESFEGGYVDNPHDPGGATMAGVTQATYTAWLQKHGRPNAPVKGIPLSDRQAIYRDLFWNSVHGDDLFDGLDLVVVDSAWGSGPFRAIEWLQQGLGVSADGEFGPQTSSSLARVAYKIGLINAVCAHRMKFFQGLSTWKYFGDGWTKRLNGVQEKALAMNKVALAIAGRPVQVAKPINQPAAAQPSPSDRIDAVQAALAAKNPTVAHEGWLAELEALVGRFEAVL